MKKTVLKRRRHNISPPASIPLPMMANSATFAKLCTFHLTLDIRRRSTYNVRSDGRDYHHKYLSFQNSPVRRTYSSTIYRPATAPLPRLLADAGLYCYLPLTSFPSMSLVLDDTSIDCHNYKDTLSSWVTSLVRLDGVCAILILRLHYWCTPS